MRPPRSAAGCLFLQVHLAQQKARLEWMRRQSWCTAACNVYALRKTKQRAHAALCLLAYWLLHHVTAPCRLLHHNFKSSVLLHVRVCIGVLGSLQTFFIAGNSFTGTIPEDLLYLPAIRRIDLSNNKFFGTIPLVAIGCVVGHRGPWDGSSFTTVVSAVSSPLAERLNDPYASVKPPQGWLRGQSKNLCSKAAPLYVGQVEFCGSVP